MNMSSLLGSRQQSRFIAMVSDYDRTMELMNAANNSAGASQEQFNKTLEGLDAKLEQLNAAWQQFVMGLANNEAIKIIVDLLTGFLNTLNSVIDAISGGNGVVKALASLGTVIGGLKLGGMIFGNTKAGQTVSGIIGKLSENEKEAEKQGKSIKDGLIEGFQKAKGKASEIKQQGFFKTVFGYNKSPTKEGIKAAEEFNAGMEQKITGAIDFEIAKNKQEDPREGGQDLEYQAELAQQKNEIVTIYRTEGAEAAQKALKDYGVELDVSKKSAEDFGTKSTINFNAVATAAGLAGGALMGLAAIGEDVGWAEELITFIRTLGTALMSIPAILAVVKIAYQIFGKSIEATTYSLPIVGWILGIVSLLGVLAGAFMAFKADTAEEELKKAQESAEKAAEAANKATEAFNELQTSLDGLESKYDGLRELIQGTKEWKDSVKEINNEVLDLINKYPELAAFVENKGGILTIDVNSKEVQDVLKEYENVATKAATSKVATDINVAKSQREVDYQNLQENYIDKGLLRGSKTLVEQLARGLAEGTITKEGIAGTQSVEDFAKQTGLMVASDDAIEALRKFGNSLITADNQLEVYYNSMAQSAAELMKQGDLTDEEFIKRQNQMSQIFGQRAFENQIGMIEDALSKELKTNETYKEIFDKYFKSVYGQDVTADYKGVKGTDREGNEVNLSSEDAKAMFAAAQATEIFGKRMQELSVSISKLNETDQKALTASLSGDYGNLNRQEIDRMGIDTLSGLGYGSTKEAAEALGFGTLTADQISAMSDREREELFKAIKSDKTNIENFTSSDILRILQSRLDEITSEIQLEAKIEVNKEEADKARKEVETVFDSKGIKIKQIDIATMSNDTISNISDQIRNMSNEQAQNYVKVFNETLARSNLGADAKASLEGYLSTIDWTSMTDALNAMDYMRDLGLDENVIRSYWEAGIEGGQTYCHTLEEVLQLTKRFQGNIQSADEIYERLIEGKATDDDLKALWHMGIDTKGKYTPTESGYQMSEDNARNVKRQLLEANVQEAKSNYELLETARQKAFEDIESKNAQYTFVSPGNVTTSADLFKQENGRYVAAQNWDTLSAEQKSGIGKYYELKQFKNETQEEYFARVEKYYQEQIDLLNNGEEMVENARMAMEMSEQAVVSGATGQEVLDAATPTGMDEETATQYKSAELDKLMQSTEGASAAYQELLSKIKDVDKLSEKERNVLKALAIDYQNLSKNIKTLNDKAKSYQDTLVSSKRGTGEYNEALEDMANQMKETFKLDDAPIDFLLNNLDLLEGAVAGQEGAWDNLRDEMLKTLVGEEEDITGLANRINNLDPTISIASQFDPEGVMASILGLQLFNDELAVTEENLKKVESVMGLFGYEIEWEDMYLLTPQFAGGPEPFLSSEKPSSSFFDYEPVKVMKGLKKTASDAFNTTDLGGGSSSDDGGGSEEAEPWENPYDELYNKVEALNEQLRIREKLERDYQRLLENESKFGVDVVNNALDQIAALEKEISMQEEMAQARRDQAQRFMDENEEMLKYGQLFFDETGEVQMRIDWDLIDQVTDEEEGQSIEDYISELEERRDQIREAIDAAEDCRDTLSDIYNQGKEEYFDLEQQVYDALVQLRQDEIDQLSSINDTINDANSRLIDSIQNSIDQYRQDRDNARTEEDIEDKQRRLAYLQQDTSGANALEILKLQDEIEQAQEDYTDTLIDQKISELQQQNDKAAEQREQQISILEAQLKYDQDNGVIAAKVEELLNNGLNGGVLSEHSDLYQLLSQHVGIESMTGLSADDWFEDLQRTAKLAYEYMQIGLSSKAALDRGELTAGQDFTFTDRDGKEITGKLQADGSVVGPDGTVYSGIHKDSSGNWVLDKNATITEPTPPPAPPPAPTPAKETPTLDARTIEGVSAAVWNGNQGWGEGTERANKLKEVFGQEGQKEIQAAVNDGTGKWRGDIAADYGYMLMRKKFKGYKTGGLADYTGLAWLDGTPSKPEIILNQKDSQNFMILKDVLASLMTNSSGRTSQNGGDNYFDIDISVEKLEQDYDVDRVADRIKRLIYEDGQYRNVNVINNLR